MSKDHFGMCLQCRVLGHPENSKLNRSGDFLLELPPSLWILCDNGSRELKAYIFFLNDKQCFKKSLNALTQASPVKHTLTIYRQGSMCRISKGSKGEKGLEESASGSNM